MSICVIFVKLSYIFILFYYWGVSDSIIQKVLTWFGLGNPITPISIGSNMLVYNIGGR